MFFFLMTMILPPSVCAYAENIGALLQQAEQHLARDQLMRHKTKSAYAKFKRVLEIDPGNSQANTGLRRVFERYIELAEQALSRNRQKEARILLKSATLLVNEGHGMPSEIMHIQQELEGGFGNLQQIALTPLKMTQQELERANAQRDWRREARGALYWANQGSARAQYRLGEMYSKGVGVSQSFEQAITWHQKAAQNGFAQAQFYLGIFYATGKGVPQNFSEAAKWYLLAAEQWFAPALVNLGVLYAKGDGVTKSFIQAHKWFDLARQKNPVSGLRNLEQLESMMTPEQIEEARSLTRAWLNSPPKTE
ncbi:putative Sel1-like protein [Magnetofaba australis IT-1]|uniref:Putative Sel1-like protein n=1 Tax=Magnetofaba australis IT-1 TaxID=1434232 RepID=A0A1Y2K351_9PROT|nr:putative Sel1-like protein [Magnetofaba australis IT-1]